MEKAGELPGVRRVGKTQKKRMGTRDIAEKLGGILYRNWLVVDV